MEISKDNTHWVLSYGSATDPKTDRFLADLYYAYKTLINIGVPSANIDVLIDPLVKSANAELVQFMTDKPPKLLDKFEEVISNNGLENLIIVVSGHGGVNGIDSMANLKPYSLVSMIHARENLKHCAVVFGQCIAGVYNYMDLIKKDVEGLPKAYPTVCFIGASHLNSSISDAAEIQSGFRWQANIFLLHFFEWFTLGYDVDGDGKATLMDAFKYAGAKASEKLIAIKAISTYQTAKQHRALDKVIDELEVLNNDATPSITVISAKELELKSIEIKIMKSSGVSHANQDPWILNSNMARDLVYTL